VVDQISLHGRRPSLCAKNRRHRSACFSRTPSLVLSSTMNVLFQDALEPHTEGHEGLGVGRNVFICTCVHHHALIAVWDQ
jgi:hypothetical protein